MPDASDFTAVEGREFLAPLLSFLSCEPRVNEEDVVGRHDSKTSPIKRLGVINIYDS